MLISCTYKKQRINLIGDKNKKTKNSFSVLVGVNGVGKSRFLSAISINSSNIDKLPMSTRGERLLDISSSLNPEYSKKFSTVIACSVSPFDKFPVIKKTTNQKSIYKYLGIRGISGENIGFTHMSRVVGDLLKVSQKNKNTSSTIKNILKYLGYSDKLTFEFKISTNFSSLIKTYEGFFNKNDTPSHQAITDIDPSKSIDDLILLKREELEFYFDTLKSTNFSNKNPNFIKNETLLIKKKIINFLENLKSFGFSNLKDFYIVGSSIRLDNEEILFHLDENGFSSSIKNQKFQEYIVKNFDNLINNGVLVLKNSILEKSTKEKLLIFLLPVQESNLSFSH